MEYAHGRRQFLKSTALAAPLIASVAREALAQVPGDRPVRPKSAEVLNPRERVPVSFIIDDSTCLVNLNKFAMPQFDAAFEGANATYHRNWREWSDEIPDDFVRKFGSWCGEHGVKGKYSIVPYPACVGRLDRELPGWSPRDLQSSLELVRTLMTPNWDIHPEMVTHTRVIDLRTGHPFPDRSLKFMENWEWTTGRSTDEIADYLRYALTILKNVGLNCEGITTPGGFGTRALPQLAQASLVALRDIFGTEIPHYFRHLYDEGTESVAPRVEYASGLDGADPRCVVSIIACTGDWTGGWDNSPPEGVDRFITADGSRGRLVDVIRRGEPACLLAHWTGIWFNGEETGFRVFQEVVHRLHQRFDHLEWMKLAEIARYWAARELTRIESTDKPNVMRLTAPFSCPGFTVRFDRRTEEAPRLLNSASPQGLALSEVASSRSLRSGTWRREGNGAVLCWDLAKGINTVLL
ncbi:MAG: hypothetical protein JNK85_27790 [Verrucomicrobiales bacterium]|nr:hypothetical protein [Verrucomicrobiales bacterium]